MPDIEFYRGGNDLTPRDCNIVTDPATGLILPERGVSVSSSPKSLTRHGGPFRVTNVPPELEVRQIGRNLKHYEIVPRREMSRDDYLDLLGRIVLVPVP